MASIQPIAPLQEYLLRKNALLPNFADAEILEIAVRDLRRRLAAVDVAEHGLRAGELVYWIQIQNLREIFRRLNDASKMDAFHDVLEAKLALLLSGTPKLGRFLHINFHDIVIASNLSKADVKSRVVAHIVEQVGGALGADLPEVVKRGLILGSGASFEQAFVDMKLFEFGTEYGDWLREATNLRQRLLQATATSDTTWESLLRASRQFGRNSSPETIAKLDEWLLERKVSAPASDVRSYGWMLTMADYLRPVGTMDPTETRAARSFLELATSDRNLALVALAARPSWSNAQVVRRQVAANAELIHVVIAIDLKNLGATNRLAQDRWLERGADVDTMAVVSSDGDARIVAFESKLRKTLVDVIGEEALVLRYWFGDDSIWLLPELTDTKLFELRRALAMIDEAYFEVKIVKDRDAHGVSRTIGEAQAALLRTKQCKMPSRQLARISG